MIAGSIRKHRHRITSLQYKTVTAYALSTSSGDSASYDMRDGPHPRLVDLLSSKDLNHSRLWPSIYGTISFQSRSHIYPFQPEKCEFQRKLNKT